MHNSRREFLAGIGGLAAFAASSQALSSPSPPQQVASPAAALPAKSDFAIPEGVTYINSAFTHPMPVAAAQAVRRYVDVRS
ncbi:MAG: hypothetical protein WA020_08590, partial [Candidatus Acidiferrales bacterium]